MGRPAILKVDILADAKGVGPGVAEAEGKFSRLGGAAKKMAKVAAVGFAAAAAGAVVVGKKLIDAGERAGTSNARIQQVAKSMGLFGKESDKVAGRLVKLAEATARQTGMDQNAIKETQAKLLTFKELAKSADTVGGSFDRATAAAVDLEAAGFGQASTNAVQLGKALNDPIKGLTALSRSGITFTETEKARITTLVESNKMGQAQEQILAAIEKQVSGTAKATANGTDRMRVGFSQVAEKLGQKLVPLVDKFATFLLDKAIPGATRLAKDLQKRLGPAFTAVGKFITEKAIPAAQGIYSWFIEKIVPGIQRFLAPVLAGLRTAFSRVSEAIERNRPQLEKILTAFKKVAEFIAAHVMPILGKVVGEGFKVLGGAVSDVIDIVARLVGWIDTAIGKIQDLIGWVKNIKIPDLHLGFGSHGGYALGSRATRQDDLATGSSTGDAWAAFMAAPAATFSRTVVIDARAQVDVHTDGLTDENAIAARIDRLLRQRDQRLGRTTVLGLT